MNLEDTLKQYFGYNTFRAHQKEIIEALLRQEDVLAILPTGAGKSICYQLPALLLDKTAIVISPLISLMQDQVVSLYKNDISAAFISSSLHSSEVKNVLQNLTDYKLLYIAPERLADPEFINRLKETPISFFVVDEAHCISQWGHSFRIEYRKLAILKQNFPDCPIIAVTATATQDVEKDIQIQLQMKKPNVIKASFDRPNLTIHLSQKYHPEKQLIYLLAEQTKQSQSGIIYASTRKKVEDVFAHLKKAGYSVGRYHAGLSSQERSLSQHAFLHDEVQIMVATVAFGMGIHKPDIRFIIHMDMPRTIEQYYQEIGRAGRDGLPASCFMLYSIQDFMLYKVFLEQVEDPHIQQQMKKKMDRMLRFCQSVKCRRCELLHYFGEKISETNCASCDNCLESGEQIDGSVIAQKILSCVYRLKQNIGVGSLIEVLRGSKNQWILQRHYDQLSTYGILKDFSLAELRYYIDSLLAMHFLLQTSGEYPVLKWTEQSRDVVEGIKKVYFRKRRFAKEEFSTKVKDKTFQILHEEVLEELRQLRLDIAREEQVPPFVVFSDRALQEMAVYFPQTEQEFSRINGVGPIKWVKYGKEFLTVLVKYKEKRLISREKIGNPIQKQNSMQETIQLYQEGYTLEQIIEKRQLVRSTLITHLVEAIEKGVQIKIDPLVSPNKQKIIREALAKMGHERLAPIKQQLPDEYSYEEIRLVAADYGVAT
jgi:ATP-dependent DNA helicase RecQ